ncbi:unnamed protein product, partial [Arabidopsis halleri]
MLQFGVLYWERAELTRSWIWQNFLQRNLEIEPENSGTYILLSNIYASQGRWDDVAEMRKLMNCWFVRKSPGCSWTEVENNVHVFTHGGICSHPEQESIVKILDGLLREAGFNSDCSYALHDVDVEEKVNSLKYHSER